MVGSGKVLTSLSVCSVAELHQVELGWVMCNWQKLFDWLKIAQSVKKDWTKFRRCGLFSFSVFILA